MKSLKFIFNKIAIQTIKFIIKNWLFDIILQFS